MRHRALSSSQKKRKNCPVRCYMMAKLSLLQAVQVCKLRFNALSWYPWIFFFFCQCGRIMFLCQPGRWMVSLVLWERVVPVARPATVSLSLVIVVFYYLHHWSCCYWHHGNTSHRLVVYQWPGWESAGMERYSRLFPFLLDSCRKTHKKHFALQRVSGFHPISQYVIHCLLLFCVTTVLSDYRQCSLSWWTVC